MTNEILIDRQLDMVIGGLLKANIISPEEDGRLEELLRERQFQIEDREWRHKVWEAYQENNRKWIGTVIDVVRTGIEVGKIVATAA